MIYLILLLLAAAALGITLAEGIDPMIGNIVSVARNAGFQGEDLAIAVAVALAESGGNAMAYNPETAAGTPAGMGSYGLWQIYLKVHQEFIGWDLYDPQMNAKAAFQVYQAAGNSFIPWSTFKNDNYLAQLDNARAHVGV